MTTAPLFPGFDGLMTLSRREGVDIRPTLLRVLTDLYVQASVHSVDEERQFVELTSRLIDQVDDATRAAVRARLATDVGIGVTGVAGPDEQEGKPVGTMYIAVASAGRSSDTSQHFRGPRTVIKSRAAITALNLLRVHLLREE